MASPSQDGANLRRIVDQANQQAEMRAAMERQAVAQAEARMAAAQTVIAQMASRIYAAALSANVARDNYRAEMGVEPDCAEVAAKAFDLYEAIGAEWNKRAAAEVAKEQAAAEAAKKAAEQPTGKLVVAP